MHTLLKSHFEDPLSNTLLAGRDSSLSYSSAGISPRLRQKLLYMHVNSFDWEHGGLNTPIKFLDRDSIEYSLCQAAAHDRNEERMARLSLTRGMGLLDQDKGGIYQFATRRDWQQSHYSKSIAAQAGSLRLYSLAYALLREHTFLATARNIHRYLAENLLTADGVFQSLPSETVVHLDDYNREQVRIRTRENAWLIEALASFYEFCGESAALGMAVNAAKWLLARRRLSDDMFSGGELNSPNSRLSDNLAMARAMLQLYRTTTEQRYLQLADDCARAICTNYKSESSGFNSLISKDGTCLGTPQIDENICLARFLNLLHYYTGRTEFLDQARHGLRYLAIPQVATSRMEEAGILLLDEELSTTPLKILIIGDKDDDKAGKLYRQALHSFGWYKVLHWRQD